MDGNNMNNEFVNEVTEVVGEAVVEPANDAADSTYTYNAVENSYDYAAYDEEAQSGGNGLAVAAMVCGIAADVLFLLSFCCLFLRMVALFIVLAVGIAGLVMGIIAKKKEQKKAFWLTAIICSSIVIAFVLITFAMVIVSMFLSTSLYTLPFLGELFMMLGL